MLCCASTGWRKYHTANTPNKEETKKKVNGAIEWIENKNSHQLGEPSERVLERERKKRKRKKEEERKNPRSTHHARTSHLPRPSGNCSRYVLARLIASSLNLYADISVVGGMIISNQKTHDGCSMVRFFFLRCMRARIRPCAMYFY